MTNVTVVGSGSWGTTFGMVHADAGCDVTVVARRPEVVNAINQDGRNPEYLSDIELPRTMVATSDVEKGLAEADIVVLAIPAQVTGEFLQTYQSSMPSVGPVVSLSKGIDVTSGRRMSQIIEANGVAPERVTIVSGPNLAKEVAMRQPSATVVGSTSLDTATFVAQACSTPYFRPYALTDVVGVEIGGSVKNVIALAVGVAVGKGLGHNSQAALITRGLAETTRLAAKMGGDPLTLSGLAGMGDLVATCMSPLSRNRTVGVRLGQGESLQTIMATKNLTAEGVKSCAAIQELAQEYNVDMPIVNAMAGLLAGEHTVEDLASALLERPLRTER